MDKKVIKLSIMYNYNVTDLPPHSTTKNYGYNRNDDNDLQNYGYNRNDEDDLQIIIALSFIILISIFGMLGNGMVIWLLGFRIKRNPFTTFVLNLAIADFGVLTGAAMYAIFTFQYRYWPLLALPFCMYSFMLSASQYTLTVISVDRCVSVFFPLWHRCHRPRHLSAIVCTTIWGVSLIPLAIALSHFDEALILQLLVNGSLCFPFMTVSSLMLFFKICCKSKQQRRQKALITVLLTVFIFLFLSFPTNGIAMISYFNVRFLLPYFPLDPIIYALICAVLNSSVNPFIYYLVSRAKKGRSKKSMKAALLQLFKEEDNQVHVVENAAETPL